jgi:hypothetical protein
LIFQSTGGGMREIGATDLTAVRVSRISHFSDSIKIPTAGLNTSLLNTLQHRTNFSFSIH